jgi:acylphosphatase
MKKQIHAYFSGKVQGVGFRFTARDIADDLQVTGWVKNCADGKVEVVAEADEDALIRFLERLNKHFLQYIRDTDVEWGAATGVYKDFGMRF